jgi:hypothetical protein
LKQNLFITFAHCLYTHQQLQAFYLIMKQFTFIGDTHGDLDYYKYIVEKSKNTYHVGDFGFRKEWIWLEMFLENLKKKRPNDIHLINMGNHDDTSFVNSQFSCGNHSYKNGIFTIRGANSIDKNIRAAGINWWDNEELNYIQALAAYDLYIKEEPRIVVTHDCPQSICNDFFSINEKSMTRTTLEQCYLQHQPDIWIFGHHHKDIDITIGKTRFVCLGINKNLTIDV